MIYSAARSNEFIIRAEDFNSAWSTLSDAEKMMPSAFKGYGRNELAKFIELAMEEIKTVGAIYVREFIKRHRSQINVDDVEKIIKTLEMMGYCKVEHRNSGKILRYTPDRIKKG